MKKILTLLLVVVMLTALVVPAFAANDVAYVDYTKKNSNDGLTAATAKQSFDAEGKGITGVIPDGGTVVASGKLYFGGNYTIKIPVTITANYGGKDYKNPKPENNPTAGQMKMSGGSTLTIKSDVVIDDIILFQEKEQNTIVVANGGSLTVTDKVVCMTAQDYYINIEVQKGGKLVLNGGIFEDVTGNGDITIADNVVIKSKGENAPSTDTPAPAASGLAFINHAKGSDGNSGTSAQYPKKLFGTADGNGVMSLLTKGGTMVVTGKAFVGADYTFPKTENPLIVTSFYDGVNYKVATPSTNPDCAFKMAGGKTLTIAGETTFDNIILFQEAAQNTILVKEGAVLTVTDTVDLMTKTEYHFKVVLEKGAKAILSAEAQKTFSIANNGGTVETYVSSTPAPTVVKLTIGNKTGYVDGVAKELDAAPVIKNGRTMLPIRFVAEALGAVVGWDGATSSVTVTTATTKLELKVGTATAKLNGVEQTLDAASFIESGRTYLPVRFVAEALGAKVDWDGATSTATLTK